MMAGPNKMEAKTMKINLTITLTESEARTLWAEQTHGDTNTPTGQDLADWVAEHAANTVESNWEYDAGVFAALEYTGETDTADLLRQILACDAIIGDGDTDFAETNEAKEERDRLKGELGLNDLPENSEAELEELLRHYGLKPANYAHQKIGRHTFEQDFTGGITITRDDGLHVYLQPGDDANALGMEPAESVLAEYFTVGSTVYDTQHGQQLKGFINPAGIFQCTE